MKTVVDKSNSVTHTQCFKMGIVRAIFVSGCFKKNQPYSKYLHLFDIL